MFFYNVVLLNYILAESFFSWLSDAYKTDLFELSANQHKTATVMINQ